VAKLLLQPHQTTWTLSDLKQIPSLTVMDETEENELAHLLPINQALLNANQNIPQKLCDWRIQFAEYFLSKTDFSAAKTLKWLQNDVIPRSDKILFLIQKNEDFIGHIGFANVTAQFAEIDNVICFGQPKGFFTTILNAMVALSFDILRVERVRIACLANNPRAVNAYQKVFRNGHQDYCVFEMNNMEAKNYELGERYP
jgi:RimJ/RimL family protein N-acetyltransferase